MADFKKIGLLTTLCFCAFLIFVLFSHAQSAETKAVEIYANGREFKSFDEYKKYKIENKKQEVMEKADTEKADMKKADAQPQSPEEPLTEEPPPKNRLIIPYPAYSP